MPKKARISKIRHYGKKAIVSQPEIYSKYPKWRFHRMDWNFSQTRLNAKICTAGTQLASNTPKVECCFHLFSDRLKYYETMTWSAIIQDNKTGSHFISLAGLESHNRTLYNEIARITVNEETEEIFSLRLAGRERLWGIILEDGTFDAVFYDPNHQGWPTEKKNT
jgi:hypothetical protein